MTPNILQELIKPEAFKFGKKSQRGLKTRINQMVEDILSQGLIEPLWEEDDEEGLKQFYKDIQGLEKRGYEIPANRDIEEFAETLWGDYEKTEAFEEHRKPFLDLYGEQTPYHSETQKFLSREELPLMDYERRREAGEFGDWSDVEEGDAPIDIGYILKRIQDMNQMKKYKEQKIMLRNKDTSMLPNILGNLLTSFTG